jgi:regulator of protease activity HflC (stomatin/prohibitin superfamily)
MQTGFKERLAAWWRRRYLYVIGFWFIVVFAVIYFSPYIFFTVDSGHAGVVFRRFFGGTVTRYVRDEGFQIIPPWDKLTIYDVRVQQVEHSFHVISSNGLDVTISVSIRYHPKVELLGVLHKEVGPDYLGKIVIPEVQALVREVFGQYTPEEMYTTKRSLIEQTLQGALGKIAEKYVVLDDLLIKTIELPPAIEAAIEAKLIEEQRSLEMKFRIEREKSEAERKVIEAGGVDEAQEIIGRSLTDQLLQYKGIEATLALAESPNAKVVVIGGRNGLPIILDAGFNESGSWLSGLTNLTNQTTLKRPRPGTRARTTNAPAASANATNRPEASLSSTNQTVTGQR